MELKGAAGDKTCYTPTPEDLRLREVYGNWVHAKPGTHLAGAVMPLRRYDAPSGRVGRRFVGTLGAELKGVRDRMWKSERFIVFQTVILQ